MPYSTRRLAKTSFVSKTNTTPCHYKILRSSTSPYYVYPSYDFDYSQTLDHSSVYNPLIGDLTPYRFQPQVHLGMCAIPQLDPSTESTTFMNACIYYQVHCSISIVYDQNSRMWQVVLALYLTMLFGLLNGPNIMEILLKQLVLIHIRAFLLILILTVFPASRQMWNRTTFVILRTFAIAKFAYHC